MLVQTKEPCSGAETDLALPAVIGLEGLPYAGKTLLSKSLHEHGLPRLGELAEFFQNGLSFPAFSENTEDARESFSWFVDAELRRYAELESYPNWSPIISDRTLVSSLAYTYARRKVYQIGDQLDEHALVRRAISEGLYFVPPLIYVRIPIETYFERREANYDLRCETLGKQAVENVSIFEREREFFEAQIEYYDTLAKRLATDVCILDGTEQPQVNFELAKRWCSRKFYNYQTINIEDALL